MTALTEPGMFQAGIYPDMPEDAYHADPVPGGSLSASGAKKLLACPARFAYDRDRLPQATAAMELGTAAHKLVFGVGAQLAVVDAENWRTKAAQRQRAAERRFSRARARRRKKAPAKNRRSCAPRPAAACRRQKAPG